MPLDLETHLLLTQRVLVGPRQEREAALMELVQRVNQHPEDPDYVHALAQGLVSLGRHGEAAGILSTLVESYPDRWYWRTDLAASSINSGDFERARAVLEEAEMRAPSAEAKASARDLLDQLRAREEDVALLSAQIAVLRERVADGGGDAADAVLLARRLIQFGFSRRTAEPFDDAAAVLEQARERFGDSVSILESLIICYRQRDPHGRHSEAMRALETVAPEHYILEMLASRETPSAPTRVREQATEAIDEGADLERAGDVDGACAAYQRAIDSGDAEYAPVAASALGRVLAQAGDYNGARAALQVAIDSAHAAARPKALRQLGDLLRKRGEIAAATAAYHDLVVSDRSEEAAWGAISLGAMLEREGDLRGARRYYSVAFISGHKVAAAAAALGIGNLLMRAGDLQGAREHYDAAVQGGNYEAASAWKNIASIEIQQGDHAAAREAFEQAIAAADPEISPIAALHLGITLYHRQDYSGMRDAFQRAIDSDHDEAAPAAARHLGDICAYFGDFARARPALERAIASGHAEHAPAASLRLGLLLEDEEDVEGALTAFEQAMASPDPAIRDEATHGLAMLGPIARAKRLLRDAADLVRPPQHGGER